MKVVKCGNYYINLDLIAHVWFGEQNIQIVYGDGAMLGLQPDDAKPLLEALERYVIVGQA